MVRRGLIFAVLWLLVPVAAKAQQQGPGPRGYTGFATAFIGVGFSGDVDGAGWTPGVSAAVIDQSGFGAEVDLSHLSGFNSFYDESGVTTFTINATWVWPNYESLVRPYIVGGAGVLRVRACDVDCLTRVSRTDWAMDIGGGAFVVFNEKLGARADLRYFRYLERPGDVPTEGSFFDFWRLTGGFVFSWPIR